MRSTSTTSAGAAPAGRATTPGRRTDLADAALRARPLSDRRDQVLPVSPVLGALVPGGLIRGSVVAVGPSAAGATTSLAWTLLAAASGAGSWCAGVGTTDVGVVAVDELGVDLDRLVLVPEPGRRWAEVVAALVPGMDIVLLAPPGPVGPGMARRVVARARERRAVLVVLDRHGRWPIGPDLRLTVTSETWEGLGAGHGHLHRRRLSVQVSGRRAAARARTDDDIWLPGGHVRPVAGTG